MGNSIIPEGNQQSLASNWVLSSRPESFRFQAVIALRMICQPKSLKPTIPVCPWDSLDFIPRHTQFPEKLPAGMVNKSTSSSPGPPGQTVAKTYQQTETGWLGKQGKTRGYHRSLSVGEDPTLGRSVRDRPAGPGAQVRAENEAKISILSKCSRK